MKNFYHISYRTSDNKVGSFQINAKNCSSALDDMYKHNAKINIVDRIYENTKKVYERF